MNKRFFKFEDLKQLVSRSLIVGLVLGLIFGMIKAFLHIYSHRYFELGMYNIAFSDFRSIVNYFSLIFIPGALVAFLVIVSVYLILTAFLKDSIESKRPTSYALTIVILIGLLLIVGYELNKSPWYPPLFSVKGLLYNLIVIIFFIFLGLVFLKLSSRMYALASVMLPKVCNLRIAIIPLFLLLVLNGLFYYQRSQADYDGLNVLFITVDTLRADHLGVYGYARDTSPNIDKLAKEGILFSQAVVQWPKTRPSMVSMLTSTYGHYNGVIRINERNSKVNSKLVLLAEILKNARYDTAAVISNGVLAAAYDMNQGFNTYIEVWRELKTKAEAKDVTAHAVSWLRNNAQKRKFFMWIHYNDPHFPYEPPERYHEMYLGDRLYEGSEIVPVNHDRQDRKSKDVGGIWPEMLLGGHRELDYYIAQYDAEIRYTDENVGRVLETVKELGLRDKTIVIFTADHGESLGDHNYYFDHGRLPYDTCIMVPLIIKVPGLESGIKVIEHPVELINLMPTIFDILGIPPNEEAQGQSLLPLRLGDVDGIPEYTFTEAGYRSDYQRMIRSKKWKLIYIPDKEDQSIMQNMPFELYDIENDPDELNNLVNVEVEIADQLRKELFEWMDSANASDGVESFDKGNVRIDQETEENLRSLGYIE